jgi:uncharacterized protein YfaP (DUF2135 family)
MWSSRGILVAFVFFALVTVGALMLIATPAHAADIYIGGDWVVDTIEEHEGDEIIVRGNINIRDGGELTLRNSTLMVDSRSGDAFRLKVEETGNLYAYKSVITNRYSSNNNERFFFDVYNDTIFKDTTISRLYGWNGDNPGGLRFFEGHHLIVGCTITDSRTYGIYTRTPITMRETTIRSTGWARFQISTDGWDDEDMYWILENCTFIGNAGDPYSYGVYTYDGYAGQYVRNLNVSHCNFEGLSYGMYIRPEWRNGVVEASYNDFDRNSYGIRAYTNSIDIFLHHNHYSVRSGGYGIRLYQGSYGNCTWQFEDIRGASQGDGTGAYLEGAGTGTHRVLENSIWGTNTGIVLTHGPCIVRDSYINTTNNNFYVYYGTTIDIYNTRHDIGSGFVDTTGGRITAWQRLNITSVKWSDGTPITEGIVYLLNETDVRIGSINLTLGPTTLDFKRWEAKRSYVWYNIRVFPALLDVDTYFRASELDYLEAGPQDIVFTDNFAPLLTLPGLQSGDRINVSYMILEGSVVERGRGLLSVEVSPDGITWHAASITDEMWDFVFNRIDDGKYDIHVRATDKAGNMAEIVREGVIIDTEPPMIFLYEVPPLATNEPLLVLRGRTEPGATIYMGQSIAWPDEDGEFTLEYPLKEGTNGLVLKVQDVASNWNQTVITIMLDITPPTLSLTKPDNGIITSDLQITVAGSTEQDATITVNGVEITTYKGGFSTDVTLEDGTHTIVVEAVDMAGNSMVQFREVTVDTIAPMLVVDSPSEAGFTTTEDNAFISGRMDPDIDHVFINGKSESALPGEFAIQVDLVEGENQFAVVVRDLAGNDARTSVTIIRDTRAPKYSVEDVEVTNGGIISVDDDLFASGDDLEFFVLVDEYAFFTVGQDVWEGDGQFSFPYTLVEGTNTITIEVADQMGNLANPYTYIITYDVTEPDITITFPEDGLTTKEGEMTIRGITDDADSKIWVNDIPVGIRSDGTFEMVVSLVWGENTFEVRNLDRAGNEGETSLTIKRKEKEEVQESNVGGLAMGIVVGLVIGIVVMYVVSRRGGDGDVEEFDDGGSGPLTPPPNEPPKPPGPPRDGQPGGPGWEEY